MDAEDDDAEERDADSPVVVSDAESVVAEDTAVALFLIDSIES